MVDRSLKLITVVPPQLLLLFVSLLLAVATALGVADSAFAGGSDWNG